MTDNRGLKKIVILGSTGSVGINTLQVVKANPGFYQVAGLSAANNAELMQTQIREYSPASVYMKDALSADKIKKIFPNIKVYSEADKIHSFVADLDPDILVAASSGTSALLSVLETLKRGKRVALANKEILVMAGALVMKTLKQNPQASLLPVDSEHSAIFQCLAGSEIQDVEKLILTGSGGPLRQVKQQDFFKVKKEEVINHPKWKMGKKISVDSATLMNKGLEIIEARWLFGLPVNKIEVLIHPEAVIHSMVEFTDGSILAQLGATDMKLPIQYALSYPGRLPSPDNLKLNLAKIGEFHFYPPDFNKFPCLAIAYEAAKKSGSAPCVLSAADEVAVEAYLMDKIPFVDIPKIIENVLAHHHFIEAPDLSQIQSVYDWAQDRARKLCG